MRIYGQFRDLKNNLISVEIYKLYTGTGQDPDIYEIGDFFDNDHNFCFDGKSPVKISRKCDDLFEPIISTTCKVKLRSNIWCGDLLFANGVGDITCKVTRTINNQTELLFIGYVQPLSFNQNINKQTNIIDINCVDWLGFLKDRYLSTGNSPHNDSAWSLALSQSRYRSFIEILKKIGIFGTIIDTEKTTMFIQSDTFAANKYISDNLWLGESADDEMSCEEILLELLKYMNSRIVSINGRDYYIIENNNTTGLTGTIKQYTTDNQGGTQIENVTVSNTGILPKQDIANEQVTIDTCYNKIGVKCELETVDDVVSSPLKKESLKSPYINKQLMLREYKCDISGDSDLGIFHQWCHMVNDNDFHQVTTDKCKYKDWYFRYLDNNEWIYNNNMLDNIFLPGMPYIDSDSLSPTYNSYIWQCRLLHDLGYLADQSYNLTIQRPYNGTLGGAYFVAVGSTKDFDRTDNSPSGNVNTTNYLVIPVKGLDRGNTAADEANALAEYASLLQPYNTDPMISYQSNKTMNLSPADAQTTNYLVISGKLRCMPVYHTFSDKGRTNALSVIFANKYEEVADACGDYIEDDDMPAMSQLGLGPNGKRAYYARFFDLREPNQIVDMNSISMPPNVTGQNVVLMFPPQDNSGLYKFQYRYNQISPTSGSYYDNLTHVPILCCRLYVTRSDGQRKYVNQDPETFEFNWTEWTSSSDATFCISINPKLNDYIIGPEHEITSTVSDGMNINTSGLAIPIKIEDDVHGNVTFEILGPYNTQYDDVNKRTHSKWTQFWRGENPEDWTTTPRCLLDRISNIWISQFEIKADSDNAKNSTLNNGDLLYYSEDNEKYNNVKENIEFKISTALTSSEAAEMNVASGISYNNPTDSNGNLYTTGMQDRPECKYITTMYDLYSKPKKIVEYNCNDDTDIAEMYRSVYSCDLMSHLDISNFSSIVLGTEMDLKNNRIKISLREI